MDLYSYRLALDTITELAKNKKTGKPSELAKKFKISERTLRRMLATLREMDINIIYCRIHNSYIIQKQ
ncbi:MAG: HTH domain-containing protein [Bacteroidales bacterium]|nr:HTH domain-containing protein [Bacteroidales bacterium]